jgi:uncharacterized protein YdeI (YjbR/CyaY-like superfamily)
VAEGPAHQADQRDGVPVVLARDAGQWEAWLTDHHTEPAGAWLMIAKKNTGVTTVTQPEALDGALCFGWIDSIRRPLDETYYLQRYSRRRRGSSWSTRNADRAEALAAAGRMREAGLAEVERARAAGLFPASSSPRSAAAPVR